MPKISENLWKFSEDCWKFIRTFHSDHFPKISEDYRKLPNISEQSSNMFRSYRNKVRIVQQLNLVNKVNIVKRDALGGTRNITPSPHKKILTFRGLKKLIPAFNARYFLCTFFFQSRWHHLSPISLTDLEILSSDKGCFPLRFKSCTFSFFVFFKYLCRENPKSNGPFFVNNCYIRILKLFTSIFGCRWPGWKWVATWKEMRCSKTRKSFSLVLTTNHWNAYSPFYMYLPSILTKTLDYDNVNKTDWNILSRTLPFR